MKIALYSHLLEIVPPPKYGGTELIVYYLAEELTKRGHKVTLFARAESKTSAKLVSLGIKAKNVELTEDLYISFYKLSIELLKRQKEFDIINIHAGFRVLPFSSEIKVPHLMTYHNFFYDQFHSLYAFYKNTPATSISLDQQKKAPKEMNFVGNIYNAIEVEKFPFVEKPKDYLLWVGRIIKNKGPDIAIRVAKKLNKKLIIAGPFVDARPEDVVYGEKVKKMIDGKQIKWIGPIGGKKKYNTFAQAKAFLNPIRWNEPFGLVVPESNAGGTPILSFARGAMPEIIKDQKTGYLIKPDDINGMVKATQEIYTMPEAKYREMRKQCHKYAKDKFGIKRMVDDYEKVYKKVIQNWKNN